MKNKTGIADFLDKQFIEKAKNLKTNESWLAAAPEIELIISMMI